MRQTLNQWQNNFFRLPVGAKVAVPKAASRIAPARLPVWRMWFGDWMTTEARTKSEARAAFKRILRVTRIPKAATIIERLVP